MEAFFALLVVCAGNSPVTAEFPSQRPVTRTFDVFCGLHLNKRLSKHSRRRWFETPSRSLLRHSNGKSVWSLCRGSLCPPCPWLKLQRPLVNNNPFMHTENSYVSIDIKKWFPISKIRYSEMNNIGIHLFWTFKNTGVEWVWQSNLISQLHDHSTSWSRWWIDAVWQQAIIWAWDYYAIL